MTDAAAPRRVNRRLTARRACLLSVRYRTGKDWHPATVMDLSESGCRLRLGQDLPLGAAVTVAFETPLREGANTVGAEASGVVTWSRLEGLSHTAGIQFTNPPPTLEDLLAAIA